MTASLWKLYLWLNFNCQNLTFLFTHSINYVVCGLRALIGNLEKKLSFLSKICLSLWNYFYAIYSIYSKTKRNYLPTNLTTCLPACLPACLPTFTQRQISLDPPQKTLHNIATIKLIQKICNLPHRECRL